jgi:hypothetical protein
MVSVFYDRTQLMTGLLGVRIWASDIYTSVTGDAAASPDNAHLWRRLSGSVYSQAMVQYSAGDPRPRNLTGVLGCLVRAYFEGCGTWSRPTRTNLQDRTCVVMLRQQMRRKTVRCTSGAKSSDDIVISPLGP